MELVLFFQKKKKKFGIIERIKIQIFFIKFLIYNAKISDNNAESGKVPRMLAAFPR
jgi:hypothetical protein